MTITTRVRWLLGTVLVLFVTVVPVIYYRAEYAYAKRLREVEPGKLYRAGQLTSEGLADAVERLRIRTVINLQEEAPDPDVRLSYFNGKSVKESELCARLGVRYIFLEADLVARTKVAAQRPRSIDRFLEIMDDPANQPVLLHCRAGLHRTGILTAVFRMEYDGWSRQQAIAEVKANGFGRFACTAANDYILQYVLTYKPGIR